MKILVLVALVMVENLFCQAPVNFSEFFTDNTLRVDYYHTGNAQTEFFTIDKIYKLKGWAGNPNSCIQPFELGLYKIKVVDPISNRVIFTKGFNSIFAEYQTIGEAIAGKMKTYHETALIPYPKKPVLFCIEKRDKNNNLSTVFSITVEPDDYHINTENIAKKSDETITILNNGPSHNHVDLVILAEGYTSQEKSTFVKDLNYFSNLLFTFEPFKSYKSSFNITGIFSPSEESGTDEPRQGVYKNTRFNSTFNYFDIDRYCLADDNKSIHDASIAVPYDAVLVMINRDRYGGGGIYNYLTVFNTGSNRRDYVFIHEFGHGFAGLADEYFNSSVAYQDIYVPGVEPLEPNITSLTDPENVKWSQYLTPGLKVPTEWGKAYYDSLSSVLNTLRDEKINALTKLVQQKAPQSQHIATEKKYDEQIRNLALKADSFLFNHPLKGKIGVFEGANYLSSGYYRPTIVSIMHKYDPANPVFDVVNEKAIVRVIEYYTK